MRDGTKCDYCAQPGTRLVGESNEIIVCWNHVPNRPETERDELQQNALEMSRRAEQAERRAEGAEAEVERLRAVLAQVIADRHGDMGDETEEEVR